jgi:DNA-binding NarL/FixJ family response regulator
VLIGEATTGDEALQLCQQHMPDILLLDLHMPGPPPVETVRFLQTHVPTIRVLILTAYDDDVYVKDMLRAGVAGYILKDVATESRGCGSGFSAILSRHPQSWTLLI